MKNIRHKIPQRTCVACRKVNDKRELIRLVRIADDNIEIDTTGRLAGRGAYLCRARDCWQAGIQSGRVEYALGVSLKQNSRENLIQYAENL
jgi:predicted RNA-binding protein YlxR (DUF448 family)